MNPKTVLEESLLSATQETIYDILGGGGGGVPSIDIDVK